jgi:hypothetical protein
MRYELTDLEWTAIRLFLPNKPRGVRRRIAASVSLSIARRNDLLLELDLTGFALGGLDRQRHRCVRRYRALGVSRK